MTVHEDTYEACTQAVKLLCEIMEMAVTLPPTQMPGTGRWIARAVHASAPTVGPGRGG